MFSIVLNQILAVSECQNNLCVFNITNLSDEVRVRITFKVPAYNYSVILLIEVRHAIMAAY